MDDVRVRQKQNIFRVKTISGNIALTDVLLEIGIFAFPLINPLSEFGHKFVQRMEHSIGRGTPKTPKVCRTWATFREEDTDV